MQILTNETTKQTINAAVRECFGMVGLDYDSLAPQIVPLFEIITAHPIFVKELSGEKRLTAELAVDCIRQEMGFTANNYLRKTDTLSGFIYAAQANEQLFGCIFTERSEPTARRRFSAAHELAHYLLHFAPLAEQQADEFVVMTEGISLAADDESPENKNIPEIRFVKGFDGEDSFDLNIFNQTRDEQEREADFFAAELLMPRNACLALAEKYASKFGKNKNAVARRLATEFLVSFDAMNRRLQDLTEVTG